jgi:hypothetical protein
VYGSACTCDNVREFVSACACDSLRAWDSVRDSDTVRAYATVYVHMTVPVHVTLSVHMTVSVIVTLPVHVTRAAFQWIPFWCLLDSTGLLCCNTLVPLPTVGKLTGDIVPAGPRDATDCGLPPLMVNSLQRAGSILSQTV